jgi:hypothetical protein
LGYWQAVALDIGRDVLVMWIRGGKRWVARMRPGVIPIQLLFAGVADATILGGFW